MRRLKMFRNNDTYAFFLGLGIGIFLTYNCIFLFWDRAVLIDYTEEYGQVIHKNGIHYKLEPIKYTLKIHGQAPVYVTKEGKKSR